jgi:hypothetical protein
MLGVVFSPICMALSNQTFNKDMSMESQTLPIRNWSVKNSQPADFCLYWFPQALTNKYVTILWKA